MGPKKKNRSNNTQELKTKGKNYGLVLEKKAKHEGMENFKILKIPEKLEKEIIEIIQEHWANKAVTSEISKRISIKKLKDVYSSLSKVGFSHSQIEDAMNSTVCYGGDLSDCLDWLCLHIPDDELPVAFSEAVSQIESGEKETIPVDIEKLQTADPRLEQNAEACGPDVSAEDTTSCKADMKDWILRYANNDSSDDSQSDGGQDDPNEKYLELTAKLLDAKTAATNAKSVGNKSQHKVISQQIRMYTQEMNEIEKDPQFNPSVKIQNIDTEKASIKAEEDEESFGFDLFESSVSDPPKQDKPKESQSKESLDIRSFEYTRKQWTGKSPKQFLIDWVRKNIPKGGAPTYQMIHVGANLWKSRCRIKESKDGDIDVCPDIVCNNKAEAQHLASTLALYQLCKGQRVYQLLPPVYRDVWLEWKAGEDQQKQEDTEEENKPRDKFLSQLLKHIQQREQVSSQVTPEATEENDEDTWENLLSDDEDTGNVSSAGTRTISDGTVTCITAHMQQVFISRTKKRQYQELLKARSKLPVYQFRHEILDAVARHNVVIIAGETGSGKSTQVPQFILEECLNGANAKCNIVVTEPRRISTTSLATRVSDELGENGPGTEDSFCGYQIRFESKRCNTTRLLYCTTGVLLRRLQDNLLLDDITHIVVDEVHERSVQSDFLLILLKIILQKRLDLKVILMSATADSKKFSGYYQHCPVLNIPGRTFPVQVYHAEDIIEMTNFVIEDDSDNTFKAEDILQEEGKTIAISDKGGSSYKVTAHWTKEDLSKIDESNLDVSKYSQRTRNTVTRLNFERVNYELILTALKYIDSSEMFSNIAGAVLVFLPGLAHIQQLYDLIQTEKTFSNKKRYMVLALHSILSSHDQHLAFTVPSGGQRKIVIATNIAETGITIPDVVFVIDAGKVKENRYIESSRMSTLEEVFISKASAKQRQGRAGRVQDGYCFRLYTNEMYQCFQPYAVPEIKRVALEELCLHIMKCNLGSPYDFLNKAVDPPNTLAVQRAMSVLWEIGASISETTLTSLGQHLATLPVNVRIGKMLLYGAMMDCLEPVAVISAALSIQTPFIVPFGSKDQAQLAIRHFAQADSDHITLYNVYMSWQEARQKGFHEEMRFCRNNFVKRTAMVDIENLKKDFIKMVKRSGLMQEESYSDTVVKMFECPDVLAISKTKSISEQKKLTSKEIKIIKSVITAGLYANVATIKNKPTLDGSQEVCIAMTTQGPVQVHQQSVNRFLSSPGWLIYHEKVKSSSGVYIRDCTLIPAIPILLFGGMMTIQHLNKMITIDDWINMKTYARTATIFKELRHLISVMLTEKLENPAMSMTDNRIAKILLQLLTSTE